METGQEYLCVRGNDEAAVAVRCWFGRELSCMWKDLLLYRPRPPGSYQTTHRNPGDWSAPRIRVLKNRSFYKRTILYDSKEVMMYIRVETRGLYLINNHYYLSRSLYEELNRHLRNFRVCYYM